METLQGGDPRCGIGARLRSARERTGLTSVQAAERLHLDPDVIEALEAETFESLGPPVYVRGHLKRYAELVGERPAELQQNYASRAQMAPLPDLTRIARQAPQDHRHSLARFGRLLVLAIFLTGAAWWVGRALRDTAMPIEAVVIDPTTPVRESGEPRADPSPIALEERPGPVVTGAPSRGETALPAVAAPVRIAATPSTLVLHFSEDSWAEVYDAHGKRLLYDVSPAGTTRQLAGVAPLRVVLGNVAGVRLEFNGSRALVPGFARLEDGQARFVINRSGRIVRSRYATGGVNR